MRIPFFLCSLLAVGLLLVTGIPTNATPISFELVLRVDDLLFDAAEYADRCANPTGSPRYNGLPGFGCTPALGDVYVGNFDVDDSLLLQTGDNLVGDISNFRLQIGYVIWDQNHPAICCDPDRSDFMGFRGPVWQNGTFIPRTLGAPAPGFDIHGGLITALRGGVYGSADIPFVDFQDGGRFSATPDGIHGIAGTLSVRPRVLSAPVSLMLLAGGFALLLPLARRRRD